MPLTDTEIRNAKKKSKAYKLHDTDGMYLVVMEGQQIDDAFKAKEQATLFKKHFHFYYDQFVNKHALDTYVFCLSEHKNADNDGKLSMWRGYGSNGNGAAIIFDTSKLGVSEGSPLIFSKVKYATKEERIGLVKKIILGFIQSLQGIVLLDNQTHIPAYLLFERIKLAALFTKHNGFEEEEEWRVVYLLERDRQKKMIDMFDYSVSQNGIEPKLKLKIIPIKGLTSDDLSLSKIIDRIILGPSISSPLVHGTVSRMLEKLGKPELKSRLHFSSIPFRAL